VVSVAGPREVMEDLDEHTRGNRRDNGTCGDQQDQESQRTNDPRRAWHRQSCELAAAPDGFGSSWRLPLRSVCVACSALGRRRAPPRPALSPRRGTRKDSDGTSNDGHDHCPGCIVRAFLAAAGFIDPVTEPGWPRRRARSVPAQGSPNTSAE